MSVPGLIPPSRCARPTPRYICCRYHRAGFVHARPAAAHDDASSTFNPDADTMRIGGQILSVYIDLSSALQGGYDMRVESMEACVRRTQQPGGTLTCTDDDCIGSNSSCSFCRRPSHAPASPAFTCIPLDDTAGDLNRQLRLPSRCVLYEKPLPLAAAHSQPLKFCQRVFIYDVLAPLQLLPDLASDVTYEFFTKLEMQLQV